MDQNDVCFQGTGMVRYGISPVCHLTIIHGNRKRQQSHDMTTLYMLVLYIITKQRYHR